MDTGESFTYWLGQLKTMRSRMSKVDVYKDQKYERIKKQLTEQKCLFTDALFPANATSLGPQLAGPAGTMEWKRPRELCEEPRLFSESSTLVRPGELSSNWMVSALCVLSGVKELCYKTVMNHKDQEWAPEVTDKYTGLFHFRFWRFGQWVEVVVDDLLAVSDGKLMFTHSQDPREFWVCLLEKAYAKLLGSYGDLEEGHLSDVLVDLTGGVSEIVDLKAGDYDTSEDRRVELLETMTGEMADHSIICASIAVHSQDEVGQRTEMGLIRGLAYHVTSIKRVPLRDTKIRHLFKGREKVAMVRLRDPFGTSRSAENSPRKSITSSTEVDGDYAYSTSQLTRLLSKNPAWSQVKESEVRNLGLDIAEDGEFWMPLEDFAVNLGELTIVRLFNNNIFSRGRKWKESCLRGSWSTGQGGTLKDRSGGGNKSSETFLKNPQYLLDVSNHEEQIVVQLLQWDGVEATTPSISPSHHLHHRTLLVGFSILRVEENRKYRVHKLWKPDQVVVEVDHQRRREIYYRGVLTRGRYVLVATSYKPGIQGNFLVRIISHNDVKLRELKRDVPSSVCTLSCISSPAVWATVVTVKEARGLSAHKSVYCSFKCENQKTKTQTSKEGPGGVMSWEDTFIFYRKHAERPLIIKVYSHNVCMRDKFIGWAELPAHVNHAPTRLEVTLLGRDNTTLDDTALVLEVLTEDNLMDI